MAMEIERKFLVTGDFRPYATSRHRIVQGYISARSGRTVRIRLYDDNAFLTIKGPSFDGGLSRHEFEYAIPKEDAPALLALCEGGIIDKTRWLIPAGERTFEVDEFHGDNQGLVVAEIELGDADEQFPRPEWLGEEVTGQRRYYNSQLREKPFCQWADHNCPSAR